VNSAHVDPVHLTGFGGVVFVMFLSIQLDIAFNE